MHATAAVDGVAFVELDWHGRRVRVEHRFVGAVDADGPLVVFLHEGLGSVSMWRDFPDRLCAALGLRGLIWSRPAYGRSTPRAAHERWTPRFLHEQAETVLPALRAALALDAPHAPPLLLFGHSDGGSIALLHAAAFPARIAGCVVLAPHIRVEPVSVESIAAAREAYRHGELRARLAKHHDDVDSAFWGWNDIWLDPAFRAWSIEDEVGAIRCPVLAIQGRDDEYGTLEQVHGIVRRLPGTRVVELASCGHSPHRDQPEAVIEATRALVANL